MKVCGFSCFCVVGGEDRPDLISNSVVKLSSEPATEGSGTERSGVGTAWETVSESVANDRSEAEGGE